MIANDKIQEILRNVDIVDVIQKYIPLNHKGKNFVGVCPFHDDSNPSLTVSREKQLFKCFVCGTGGNAINFIQKYKNISFVEAVKEVAELAEVDMKELHIRQNQVPEDIQHVYELNKEFTSYSNYLLRTEAGTKGLAYLIDRGYTKEMINDSQIGFIPNTENLVHYLNTKGYAIDDLMKNDIVNYNQNGELYSKWLNRITFPIADKRGNIHGFTARQIQENKESAKYINTSESKIFQKSSLFYNLQNVSTHAVKNKEIILMEGTSDVDQSKKLGINNVMATLGTALTDSHIRLLKSMNVQVRLCFDGDSAGQSAALKAYESLMKANINTVITILPDGMDPDSLCKSDADLFKKLILENNNYLDLKLKQIPELVNFEQREKYALDFLKSLHSFDNPLKDDHYINELSKKTKFSVESLKKSYMKLKPKGQSYIASKTTRYVKNEVSKGIINIKINFKEKDKMIYKDELEKNFDKLQKDDNVVAFDNKKILTRADILSKYMYQKGRVLETLVTVLDKESIDYKAQSIAESASHAIAEENGIVKENIQYIAYLHKDTKFPHIHIQLWQEEPYLSKYKLTENLIDQMKTKIQKDLNEIIAKDMDISQEAIIEDTIVPKI